MITDHTQYIDRYQAFSSPKQYLFQVLISIYLNLSFLEVKKPSTSLATMRPACV